MYDSLSPGYLTPGLNSDTTLFEMSLKSTSFLLVECILEYYGDFRVIYCYLTFIELRHIIKIMNKGQRQCNLLFCR